MTGLYTIFLLFMYTIKKKYKKAEEKYGNDVNGEESAQSALFFVFIPLNLLFTLLHITFAVGFLFTSIFLHTHVYEALYI